MPTQKTARSLGRTGPGYGKKLTEAGNPAFNCNSDGPKESVTPQTAEHRDARDRAAETAAHRDWARAGEDLLRPFGAGAHLLSALDVESEEVIHTAFGSNLPRLAAIKRKYDPANFFRVNQNIRPDLAHARAV
jgi:hypothetical protein